MKEACGRIILLHCNELESIMKRKIYLEDIPLDEALAVFEKALREAGLWDPLPAETIPVADASGRVTAEPIWAKISSPHYNASAMDGYALRSRDTEGATETNPVLLTLQESGEHRKDIARPALIVDTGQPLPPWADAVVMVEHTQQSTGEDGSPAIEIRGSLAPWRNVRLMGEDMVATELVIAANHRLRPVDLGAIAGSGHDSVKVFRKPRVAIIPTGSELVDVADAASEGVSPGSIIEYNSMVLAAQVDQWGGISTRWSITPDDYSAIQNAVLQASRDHDLILVNAGSSAGTKDYTAGIVDSLGRLLVHGIAIRPGHPVILGIIGEHGQRSISSKDDAAALLAGSVIDDRQVNVEEDDREMTAIIGVPGYPVSTALTGEIFVEPLLTRWQGLVQHSSAKLSASISRKVLSHTGDDEFVRVSVGKVKNRYIATPISRGAGVITSLVRADGIVRIPRFSEGLQAGSDVEIHLYRSAEEIENTIVAIGSHDLTLDLISQFLSARGQGQRLSSANVGSLSGLIALRKGEAHIAGSHLLDPDSGEYNDSYVKKYIHGQNLVLVTLVERAQGWIVPKGNPKGLRRWDDIVSPDIRMINRQRGAGTRVLLDFELKKRGFDSRNVKGYEDEAYTHLAVAAAVSSGAADTGLGIAAAAQALRLDFIPLATEQFDLIMTQDVYESDLLRPLLELMFDREFQAAVAVMPGYSTRRMGETRAIAG
jgi:putative molybdopterin biosynthesis protein